MFSAIQQNMLQSLHLKGFFHRLWNRIPSASGTLGLFSQVSSPDWAATKVGCLKSPCPRWTHQSPWTKAESYFLIHPTGLFWRGKTCFEKFVFFRGTRLQLMAWCSMLALRPPAWQEAMLTRKQSDMVMETTEYCWDENIFSIICQNMSNETRSDPLEKVKNQPLRQQFLNKHFLNPKPHSAASRWLRPCHSRLVSPKVSCEPMKVVKTKRTLLGWRVL